MKKIFTFTLLCLAAWGIGWSLGFYFPSQNLDQKKYTQSTTDKIHENSITRNSSSQSQQTTLISANEPSEKENHTEESSKDLSQSMVANELITVKSVSQLSSMSQIDPMVNDVISLPKKFAAEAINYEWALAREKELKDFFYKNSSFQARQVLDIVCKSSLCEIKIAVTDKKQLNAIGSDIMRSIHTATADAFEQNLMITYSQPEETGSFYIQATHK